MERLKIQIGRLAEWHWRTL